MNKLFSISSLKINLLINIINQSLIHILFIIHILESYFFLLIILLLIYNKQIIAHLHYCHCHNLFDSSSNLIIFQNPILLHYQTFFLKPNTIFF